MSEAPRTRWLVKQGVAILIGGVLLSGGSCAGFFAVAGMRGILGYLAGLFAIGFVLGVGMAIVTLVLLVIDALS